MCENEGEFESLFQQFCQGLVNQTSVSQNKSCFDPRLMDASAKSLKSVFCQCVQKRISVLDQILHKLWFDTSVKV